MYLRARVSGRGRKRARVNVCANVKGEEQGKSEQKRYASEGYGDAYATNANVEGRGTERKRANEICSLRSRFALART